MSIHTEANANHRDSTTSHLDLPELEHLLASGQILASQQPIQSEWSPCKKLAVAVLASALVEVRDHAHDQSYERRIQEDLEWIESDDAEWPFSFVRICELMNLETAWVRTMVDGWIAVPPSQRKRPVTPYRQAA